MFLFSTSQLQVITGPSSSTWTTLGSPTLGSLTDISVSDDDTSLQRADLFFGNETGSASTVATSDDAALVGREIYLGDLDPANDNNDGFGDTADEFVYGISGYSAFIVKIVIYDGSGSRSDPSNYTQFYTFWGNDADAALGDLLSNGSLTTGLGFDSSGLNYNDFAAGVCFSEGTLIATPKGSIAVEDLLPGDRVLTMDHGFQTIRWARQSVQSLDKARNDRRPVLIRKGALGVGVPAADLVVSPQHRILVGGGGQLDHLFGRENFAPAKALSPLGGIRHLKGRQSIVWVHFAFDRHEVVSANGCWTESLLLGPMALRALCEDEKRVIRRIYGLPIHPALACNGPPARKLLTTTEARRRIQSAMRESLPALAS